MTRACAVLLVFGAVVGGCARERPPAVPAAAPPVSHTRPAPRAESSDARAVPPPRGESELAERYGGRRALDVLRGEASYYGDSLAGHHTADGERYDPRAFTAAHRSLPFGTIVRVVRADTGAVTYVRVTDRGPFGSARRILDLSRAAAEELGMIHRGIADVRAEIVEYGAHRRRR